MRYTVTMDNDHGGIAMEATIGAGDFKAKCLKLLDDVAAHREPLVITKRGKPIARLVPMPPDTQLFGALAGSVLDESDIVAPINAEWDADR
jgi:prevent-host-death family protein